MEDKKRRSAGEEVLLFLMYPILWSTGFEVVLGGVAYGAWKRWATGGDVFNDWHVFVPALIGVAVGILHYAEKKHWLNLQA